MDRGGFDRDARDHDLLAAAREAAVEAEREYELARTESHVSSAQETLKERPRDVPLHQLRDRSGMYDERRETERWDNTARLLELREVQLIFDNCAGLRAAFWPNATRKEKVETLQSVEAVLAECQFRDETRVGVMWLSKGFGRSDPDKRIIQINAALLRDEEPSRALESLFHEAHHCYQFHVIDRKAPHREISIEQRIRWLEGAVSYPHTSLRSRAAFIEYYYNKLEVDARNYAARQGERFFEMMRHEREQVPRRHD